MQKKEQIEEKYPNEIKRIFRYSDLGFSASGRVYNSDLTQKKIQKEQEEEQKRQKRTEGECVGDIPF